MYNNNTCIMTISVWLQYLIKENYEHYYKIYVYIIYIYWYMYIVC